jgi:biotin transporter BioY
MYAVGATPATATATRETCMDAARLPVIQDLTQPAGKAALAVPPTAGYIYGYTIPYLCLILFY